VNPFFIVSSDCVPNPRKSADWIGARRGNGLPQAPVPRIHCWPHVAAREVPRQQTLQVTAGKFTVLRIKTVHKTAAIYSTLLQAKKNMVKLVEKIIHEKRKSSDGLHIAGDVIDVMINDASDWMTDDLISDNMIDLMIPAEDSVPILITLAIKYLSDCPLALRHLEVRTYPIHVPVYYCFICCILLVFVPFMGLTLGEMWEANAPNKMPIWFTPPLLDFSLSSSLQLLAGEAEI